MREQFFRKTNYFECGRSKKLKSKHRVTKTAKISRIARFEISLIEIVQLKIKWVDLSFTAAMNIRQLETFLAIVKFGSFARAADHIHATASTVSVRVQELEDSLGQVLFDRSQRQIRLTPKGRELCRYAEKAVSAFRDIKLRVGNGDELSGVLRLGVAEMVAVTWLPRLVDLIHTQLPKVALELNVSLTAQLFRKLKRDDLDLILIPGSNFDGEFNAIDIGQVQFKWMAGQKQIVPDQSLTLEDMMDVRILSLGRDSFHHHTVQQWFNAVDGCQARVDICDSMDVIVSLTRAGVGISLLPVCRFETDIACGDLRVLKSPFEAPPTTFFAVYKRDLGSNISALVAEFAQHASTFEKRM